MREATGVTGEEQLQKADFTSIYSQPDPRAYFESLVPLDYQIPTHGVRVIDSLLDAMPSDRRPSTVLDVCCSYGINAALLRCDLTLDELGAHYRDPDLGDLSAEQRIAGDRDFFARRDGDRPFRVVGLDSSRPAIDYSLRVGLLHDGWTDDLEHDDPSPELAAGLRDVGLVVCTGGVGYVGERTFSRILGAIDRPGDVWVVSFVLRTVDYAPVAAALAEFGLVTEPVPGEVVRQRRFADQREHEAINAAVLARGLDPTGMEADGWHYARCFVSRPAAGT